MPIRGSCAANRQSLVYPLKTSGVNAAAEEKQRGDATALNATCARADLNLRRSDTLNRMEAQTRNGQRFARPDGPAYCCAGP